MQNSTTAGYNPSMLKLYLDICCLKRPFDEPTQERIRLEAEAVLTIVGADHERVAFVRALAQDLENEQNPLTSRAARVRRWLESVSLGTIEEGQLASRTRELMAIGFRNFDALHVASAELSGANVLVTCDDRLLSTARRSRDSIRVRVSDPITIASEVFP